MPTTDDGGVPAVLKKLESDIESLKTRLENISKPSGMSLRSGKPTKKDPTKEDKDVLDTVLPKLDDWAQTLKTVRSIIDVEPNQRIATDMEMGTQSEDAGSVRQHEIPEPSHARACTLAQHAQPSASENAIANGEACEASGDSMDDTRVDTTIYASDPAENVSLERTPRADSEPVAVEVSNRGSHARAASWHPPIQPIISTETEERQTDIHNATAGPLLPGHGREDQVDDEPAEVQTQLSTDRPDLANSDDASENDNSMQLIPLGPVQQEDTPMSEVEPEVTQPTVITDATAPNSDDISANDNSNSIQSITAPGPIQQEDSPMSDIESEVTQQTATTDAVAGTDDRRPVTPGIARPPSNAEVGENSAWSSQHSDTSETLSPTSSTASGTDSIQTRLTTPDSTSMGEQVDKSPISENNTSILHDLADESCYERYFIESEDTPTLVPDQLGKSMLKTLDELSKMPNYANKAALPWIAEKALQINLEDQLKPEGDPDVQFNKFEKRDKNGIIVSRDDPVNGREFEWPNFEEGGSSMTTKQASQELARFLSAPGKEVSYYCGIARSSIWSWCPLYSGEQLDIKELTHVNEPYTHLGKKWSVTPMHKEDDIFGSVNVGFRGTKLFLRVLAEDTEKFEEWVRGNYKCKPCPQFVRHLNIFFEPKRLEAVGIRFELLIQRPGDLIETKTNQYHQVLNLQDSFAISINYLFPGITPNFRDVNNPLEVCNLCGPKGLYGRPNFYVIWVDPDVPAPGMNEATVSTKRHKRKAPPEPLEAGARNTRGYADYSETFNKTLRIIRSEAPFFSLPSKPSLDQQHVMKFAAAILSIPAIEQFKGLVSAWRNRNEHIVLSKQGDQLEQCALYLKNAAAKTDIGKFQFRHSRALMARLVDEWKAKHSLLRLGTKEKADLAQRLEMKDSELTNSLREGRMWNEICGDFYGLLPFIPLECCPPFHLSVQDWKQLGKGQLRMLHQLINCDDSRRLSQAGVVLQNIVAYDSPVVFKWEQENLDNQSLWGVVESVVAD
ncbi:histone demethylation 3d [Fusarium mundagurra]|uniref:Histone demethylation 3d n=1 Tax=Fusarium mundagurra TaxID=1567541 RepID=A0A8H6D4X5_9HYPO|nr:histone demethylation 3d [Fusarium mundagurra]